MLLRFTRDQAARNEFIAAATPWVTDAGKEPDRPGDNRPAFSELQVHRRTQRLGGGWFQTFPFTEGAAWPRRCVGLSDDGTVRFVDLLVGSMPDGMHPAAARWRQGGANAIALHAVPVVYDEVVWWDVLDVLRMIGELAAVCRYTGAWLLGAAVDGALGRSSSSTAVPPVASATRSDSDTLASTCRASGAELVGDRTAVADRLIRPVLRQLGCEFLLGRSNPVAS
jgi:hypothetical protein